MKHISTTSFSAFNKQMETEFANGVHEFSKCVF